MQLRLIWIFLIGMAATTPSWGQLGETPDQCDQRYGSNSAQRVTDGGWTFSREYNSTNFLITVRFITLSTGAKVAGWISYAPSINSNNSPAEREKIRAAASSSWAPVEKTEITKDMDPQMLELTKIHNEFITGSQVIFTKVTGWSSMRCWISPTAYAADNGSTLILFSYPYLKQFDLWQAQKSELKNR